MQHINQASYRLVARDFDLTYQMKPHYYVTSGFTKPSRSGLFDFKPSVLIKYNSEPQINVNLNSRKE